jgi:uncharacterized membrane protein
MNTDSAAEQGTYGTIEVRHLPQRPCTSIWSGVCLLLKVCVVGVALLTIYEVYAMYRFDRCMIRSGFNCGRWFI